MFQFAMLIYQVVLCYIPVIHMFNSYVNLPGCIMLYSRQIHVDSPYWNPSEKAGRQAREIPQWWIEMSIMDSVPNVEPHEYT